MSFARSVDLDRLNSLTKYPSIPTYHALDPSNGRLTADTVEMSGALVLTEKVDGTNARIVCLPGGPYIIGSRAEFLIAQGDLIGNPALGIVACVRDVAERLAAAHDRDTITVYFGEVYGGKVTQASAQYTSERNVAFRLFDIVEIEDHAERLAASPEQISAWREAGGQPFLTEDALAEAARRFDLTLTPRLPAVEALPTDHEETLAFLQATLPRTLSAIDEGAGGQPEGIVARTRDRSAIAKLRFADYRRTLKGRGRR